jgi:hypothetical protein
MSAADILCELERRGVSVTVEGDTLCLKPKKALDDALLARVRESKPALMKTLRSRPSTCALQCYEVEPGVWIHRPWTGCTTSKAEPSTAGREVSMVCWHCKGERTCDCSTCAPGSLSKAGECVWCKGVGQLWRQVLYSWSAGGFVRWMNSTQVLRRHSSRALVSVLLR